MLAILATDLSVTEHLLRMFRFPLTHLLCWPTV